MQYVVQTGKEGRNRCLGMNLKAWICWSSGREKPQGYGPDAAVWQKPQGYGPDAAVWQKPQKCSVKSGVRQAVPQPC
jgi:hypothetical protein